MTSTTADNWLFSSTEIWMPSWTGCERQDKSPDIFVQILNEEAGRAFQKKPLFKGLLLISLSEEIYQEKMLKLVGQIKELLNAKLFVLSNRSWGIPKGTGFTDAIQDLLSMGLFIPGPVHDERPIESKFAEKWTAANPQ